MRRALEHGAPSATLALDPPVASRKYARRAGSLVEEPVDDVAGHNPLLGASPSEITTWEERQEVLRPGRGPRRGVRAGRAGPADDPG